MFQTLRARLIAICVAITVFSLLTLALATFFMVRKDTLTQLDHRVGQVTQSHANELAEWVREKQRITGSLKLAVGQAEPLPFCGPPNRPARSTTRILCMPTSAISLTTPCPRATTAPPGLGTSRQRRPVRRC